MSFEMFILSSIIRNLNCLLFVPTFSHNREKIMPLIYFILLELFIVKINLRKPETSTNKFISNFILTMFIYQIHTHNLKEAFQQKYFLQSLLKHNFKFEMVTLKMQGEYDIFIKICYYKESFINNDTILILIKTTNVCHINSILALF